MHPEIQPEMQPEFEFPSTYTRSQESGLYQGDLFTRVDWA